MKYVVKCGSLVTVYRHRKIMVTAKSEFEAEEKAKDKFQRIGLDADWDIGGEIVIDDIEEMS